MREFYLNPKPVGLEHFGARGGVQFDGDGGDYELEIGAKMNASPELIALCAHHDEVLELLGEVNSPLAAMVVESIKRTVLSIKESWNEVQRDAAKTS